MSILPKLSIDSVKFQAKLQQLFYEIDMLILKSMWKCKGLGIAKTALKRKWVGIIYMTKIHYKTTGC